ncbi:MAG: phosphoethanolamine--lipid A transferase EptA [Alistipes sp.]|nr:phosphoethanolamine--lipid A transferase EptA [Alistipes sp.]
MKTLQNKISLTAFCALLSGFTLLAFHIPFFRVVFNNSDWSLNGLLIKGGLAVIMFALNYLIYYLLLYAGRIVGKITLAISFICNSIAFYFITTYEVLITDKMMGNVFNTQYSEASSFMSFQTVLYLLFWGILPCAYIFWRKVNYGSFKRAGVNIGIALLMVVAVVLANFSNFTWIDKNATQIGSLLMPWSYTINSIRYHNSVKKVNEKEILLPDAKIATTSKDVCVLVIGESARKDHFSLYGYERETNPLLASDDVVAIEAKSAATYTTAGVKAILDHKASSKLYEILPNYLYRNGVEVIWRTANWGEPPVHIEHYYKAGEDLKERYPNADSQYDEILLEGLKEEILACEKDKLFIVLHTSTSHGPTYYKKYPKEFELFAPVCTTVEMSKANPEELINAYDNTILYTDYLLHSLIGILKSIPERRASMLFVSDHGESLGENNLYMHGVPMSMAPKEQVEIPFIVWSSDPTLKVRSIAEAEQYYVFHSVLDFLGIESPIYNKEMTIFE